jgi:DNA-binding FadR family transcriptional regulator
MKSTLTVKRVRPAYTQVAEQLRQAIVRGEVVPGDRLPVETDLATLFGVSRSTVREALRSLASENLVVTKRGVNGGSFVAEPDAESLSMYLETSLGLLTGSASISIDDLLEARALFEVPAAEYAAKRRTEEHLQHMRSLIEEPQQVVDSDDFLSHKDFHLAIMEASGNRLLNVVTRPIFAVLRTRFLRKEAPNDFWDCVRSDHVEILEAIENKDSEAAGALMRQHLGRLRSTYESIDIRMRNSS